MTILIPGSSNDINGFFHKYPVIKVDCDSSSIYGSGYSCKNTIDPTAGVHFCSGSDANEWMNVTIPNYEILITHYSIQSPNITGNPGRRAPKSWSFHGKKNDSWILLDHVSVSNIDGNLLVITRQTIDNGPFSSFKIINEGLNYGGNNIFRIHKIDFFGALNPPFGRRCSYLPNPFRMYSIFQILALISFNHLTYPS